MKVINDNLFLELSLFFPMLLFFLIFVVLHIGEFYCKKSPPTLTFIFGIFVLLVECVAYGNILNSKNLFDNQDFYNLLVFLGPSIIIITLSKFIVVFGYVKMMENLNDFYDKILEIERINSRNNRSYNRSEESSLSEESSRSEESSTTSETEEERNRSELSTTSETEEILRIEQSNNESDDYLIHISVPDQNPSTFRTFMNNNTDGSFFEVYRNELALLLFCPKRRNEYQQLD